MQFQTNDEVDLTPIEITIHYDFQMRTLTGRAMEKSMVNRGCLFGFILHCLLVDYPEIERLYPPGILGFTLNGRPAEFYDRLEDGDRICFMVCENSPFVVQ